MLSLRGVLDVGLKYWVELVHLSILIMEGPRCNYTLDQEINHGRCYPAYICFSRMELRESDVTFSGNRLKRERETGAGSIQKLLREGIAQLWLIKVPR